MNEVQQQPEVRGNNNEVGIPRIDDNCSVQSSECSYSSLLPRGNNHENENNGGEDGDDLSSSNSLHQPHPEQEEIVENQIIEGNNNDQRFFHHTSTVQLQRREDDTHIIEEEHEKEDEDSSSFCAAEDENNEQDGNEEAERYVIKLAQITMANNGIALVRDELQARGITYDNELKIRGLKNLLSTKCFDGAKEFVPKSALIIKAIKEGNI